MTDEQINYNQNRVNRAEDRAAHIARLKECSTILRMTLKAKRLDRLRILVARRAARFA